jgi:hypothetical protein
MGCVILPGFGYQCGEDGMTDEAYREVMRAARDGLDLRHRPAPRTCTRTP